MDGCIYRTKDGECDLYAEGGKYHAFCVGDAPCDGRKQSNADKIRHMSDEELAEFIERVTAEAISIFGFGNGRRTKTFFEWLDWLKQEVSDD